VILSAKARKLWLDPDVEPDALQEILTPYPEAGLTTRRVGTQVN
jgi:putative SOS response-associated peptidase YedK